MSKVTKCQASTKQLYPPIELNKSHSSSHLQRYKIKQVHNPYQYVHYHRRKIQYENQKQQMLDALQIDSDNFEKLTYTVQQIGVSDHLGRFSIQSQRKFLVNPLKDNKPVTDSDPFCSSDRVAYQFKARPLQTSKKEQRRTTPSTNGEFFTIPEKPGTQQHQRASAVDRIVLKSKQQKKRQTVSQPAPLAPEIVFQASLPKFNSYSRLLSLVNCEKEYKLLNI